MTQRSILATAAAILALFAATGPAPAAPATKGKPSQAKVKDEVERIWPVDRILKTAVDNLSTRYNLNDEQRAFTNEMMVSRVKAFLHDHEAEIWPLIKDLTQIQRKGEAPDPDNARVLGKRVLEIIEEAKAEIFSSNDEWREILTDEQKVVHDYDLREMTKTFGQMEKNFTQWKAGKPESTGIFPPPPDPKNQPAIPPRPASTPRVAKATPKGADFTSSMAEYVKKFIADYELTAGQIETANSILREIKLRADGYTKSHEQELGAIKARIVSETDLKEKKKLTVEQGKLTRPLQQLFAELKGRLDGIPEKAQRDRFEERGTRRTSSKATANKAKRDDTSAQSQSDPKPTDND